MLSTSPTKTINILFLGGAKRVSLAERFVAAGQALGREVNIFSYELTSEVPISAIGKVIVGLRWREEGVLAHLMEVIKEYHINIVLPSVDPAITLAASLAKTSVAFIPVAEPAVCDIFYDKVRAQNWLEEHRFPVPQRVTTAPLIAKPRFGSASQGIIIMKNDQEVARYQDVIRNDRYLVQKFIEGEEYTVDSYVARSGEILSVVPRQRVEVTAGEVTKTLTIRDPGMADLVTSFIRTANLKGPLNVQIIRESSGALYIIETNPRFGGGVIASIEAGADIPAMVLKDFLGLPNPKMETWEEGLLMMRRYQELFIHSYANHH